MGEWSNLTQREKAEVIKFAINNGVSDINTIRDTFNVYAKDSLANVDYNMAAAKAAGFGSNGNGHYPDIFKKPNHPTFSDESIYHSEATPGGRWTGNAYEPSDFVLNQQGGWDNFLKGFYGQEQGTGAVPVFNGGIMLPEVTVTPQYKEGGSIHIKHPGRLTALKERTGKTEAELWATGNAHTRKMITFARNARKWKHDEGGSLGIANIFDKGGEIYIKPSKRGTFTAAATKHGKSVQEFARQVLANKENYSPAMVRKAVFAHNSAKWHKHDGLSDTQALNIVLPELTVYPLSNYTIPSENVEYTNVPLNWVPPKSNAADAFISYTGTESEPYAPTMEQYAEFKANEARRSALNSMRNLNKGVYNRNVDGANCIYTVTSRYPKDSHVTGNMTFARNFSNLGYAPVLNNMNIRPGDLLQYWGGTGSSFRRKWESHKLSKNIGNPLLDNRHPFHMGMINTLYDDGVVGIRQSNGAHVITERYGTLDNLSKLGMLQAWKYVGTPEQKVNWEKERRALYNNKKSTGGPLYPFSFQKNPYWKTPVVRYAEGGETRNWDNTLTGQLINYVENSDSIGWNPVDRTWEHPTLPGYDKNQIGMGVDKNKTPGYWDYIQYRPKTNVPFLTELDERLIRYNAIEAANKSANARYKYAQEAVNRPKGTISPVKDAAVVSAIYNLGAGYVANGLFEDKDFMLKLFDGTDEEVVDRINQEYKKKHRNERINKTNTFLFPK